MVLLLPIWLFLLLMGLLAVLVIVGWLVGLYARATGRAPQPTPNHTKKSTVWKKSGQ